MGGLPISTKRLRFRNERISFSLWGDSLRGVGYLAFTVERKLQKSTSKRRVGSLLPADLLTHAVKELPLAVVYATWSGLGIALVTVLGIFLYRQNLPWQGFAGLALIIIGVTLLNAYLPKTFHNDCRLTFLSSCSLHNANSSSY